MRTVIKVIVMVAGVGLASVTNAATQQYGDQDVLGTDTYASDPTVGATLEGLAPGAVTLATLVESHSFPFSPDPSDYPGTDQIYVGSTQAVIHDGYANSSLRINGPQTISLDYSGLVPAGDLIDTLTLGIAADDFQQPTWGQPFTASINGSAHAALTNQLNTLNQTGPVTQFFTIGLDPASLDPSHTLALEIDLGGDGGDGWAIDFLTVGVSTSPIPEPATLGMMSLIFMAITSRRHPWIV